MPLKKGRSRDTVSANVRELIRTYNKKGHIGRTKPRSKKHARKIAAAIAHDKARKS